MKFKEWIHIPFVRFFLGYMNIQIPFYEGYLKIWVDECVAFINVFEGFMKVQRITIPLRVYECHKPFHKRFFTDV